MIWVRADMAELFGDLGFDAFLELGRRTVKRSPDGSRRTAAFDRAGRPFYVKTHHGVGWREILKNWLQGKHAVVDARTEVRALERCAHAGVPVPALVAWGVEGANPATRRSFVVTEELDGAERLSEVVAREGGRSVPWARRRALARGLGARVGRLHAAGLAHRDLYLEHVFVRAGTDAPELFLLDLHRALPVARAPRWRIKDLAALAGSARRAGAARGDALAFLRAYAAAAGSALAPDVRALWRACARRAARAR